MKYRASSALLSCRFCGALGWENWQVGRGGSSLLSSWLSEEEEERPVRCEAEGGSVRQSTTDVRPRQLGAAVAKVSFSSPPTCRGQGEAATTYHHLTARKYQQRNWWCVGCGWMGDRYWDTEILWRTLTSHHKKLLVRPVVYFYAEFHVSHNYRYCIKRSLYFLLKTFILFLYFVPTEYKLIEHVWCLKIVDMSWHDMS